LYAIVAECPITCLTLDYAGRCRGGDSGQDGELEEHDCERWNEAEKVKESDERKTNS
jgi:hypothetical protein